MLEFVYILYIYVLSFLFANHSRSFAGCEPSVRTIFLRDKTITTTNPSTDYICFALSPTPRTPAYTYSTLLDFENKTLRVDRRCCRRHVTSASHNQNIHQPAQSPNAFRVSSRRSRFLVLRAPQPKHQQNQRYIKHTHTFIASSLFSIYILAAGTPRCRRTRRLPLYIAQLYRSRRVNKRAHMQNDLYM